MTEIMPQLGAAFRCLKSNKKWSSKKGKVYILEDLGVGFGPELVEYNSRWQNRLLNGIKMLSEPDAFEAISACPFCGCQIYSPFGDGKAIHDCSQCAKSKPSK